MSYCAVKEDDDLHLARWFSMLSRSESLDQSSSSNMDTPNGFGSLSMSSADTKPDISQLTISTSMAGVGHFSSVMGMPPGTHYGLQSNISQEYGMSGGSIYSTQTTSINQQGGNFFDMGMLGMSHSPLQSPSLNSQSSMSPVQLASPESSGPSMTPGAFASNQSPTSTMGPPFHLNQQGMQSVGGHNSSSTKHICAICGDRASGKHYGVYSCEGCKCFFKRTVRKDLQYACRDEKGCLIDKRQRNRCQYCRYMKCLTTGMKREAVQEERQRAKERGEVEVESTTSANSEMPVEMILDAELSAESQITDAYTGSDVAMGDQLAKICQAADKQVYALIDWAKRIPHFTELPLDDQVALLRAGWNELLIAGFSHQSLAIKDGILLTSGLSIYRSNAHQAGIGTIFDRVLTELVTKMREMMMDKTELGCLRAIVLFNPDSKGLKSLQMVESLREKVYASLDEYCKQQYPDEPGRFAKLLLRLPALRSIGLKCMEHLFFMKLIGETPIEAFLLDMLANPNPSN